MIVIKMTLSTKNNKKKIFVRYQNLFMTRQPNSYLDPLKRLQMTKHCISIKALIAKWHFELKLFYEHVYWSI